MLNLKLKTLNFYFSEKKDGRFPDSAGVKTFLEQQLGQATPSHLILENGGELQLLTGDNLGQDFTADALVTNFSVGEKRPKKIRISMVVGDCFPLTIFDQKSGNVALIHAGWRPLYLGILDHVWQLMLEQWSSDSENLWALLGPGIRAESYLMSDKPVQTDEPEWQNFVKKTNLNPDRPWQIDLPAFIKHSLDKKGFNMAHFQDCQLDTFANPDRFFSHRRRQLSGEEKGRMIAALELPI